jgi:uncharacterized protein (TIGR02145 family)
MKKTILLLSLSFLYLTSVIHAQESVQGTLKDSRDNTIYQTVQIGDQIWMAENLSYFSDSSVCYDNYNTNCYIYGRLYTWEEAKEVCPKGWRLPTKRDFEILLNNFPDGAYPFLVNEDETGFNALFGGWQYDDGEFSSKGFYGEWWSSTQGDNGYVWSLSISKYYKSADLGGSQARALSVRCIKNKALNGLNISE